MIFLLHTDDLQNLPYGMGGELIAPLQVMKSLSIPFVPALSLARVSRGLITPNSGFEYQLWLWERHGYDVFDRRVNGSSVTLVPNEAYGKFLDEVNDIFSYADEERILLAKTYWSAGIKAKLIELRRG